MRSSGGQDLGSTAELAEACRPSLGLVRKKASNRKLSRATRLNVAAASSSSSGAGSADGGGVRRSMSEQQSNVRTTAVPFASACAVSSKTRPSRHPNAASGGAAPLTRPLRPQQKRAGAGAGADPVGAMVVSSSRRRVSAAAAAAAAAQEQEQIAPSDKLADARAMLRASGGGGGSGGDGGGGGSGKLTARAMKAALASSHASGRIATTATSSSPAAAAVPTAAASAATVLVATKGGGGAAAAAPAPTVAAVTVVNFGSLQARLGEMEAVLRIGMESSDALKLAQAQVSESLAFLALLAAQAAERGVLQGAAFQALMASCGPSMGHLGRTPKGGTGVNSVFDDPMTTIQMAMQAQKLVNLVRVKIEDDNDLNLARQCLTDAQRGLAELSAHALKQGVSEYELYQKICGM